ncbi:MAG: hypothetical protein PVI90_00115 [Desulfobacteraceae bacterium]
MNMLIVEPLPQARLALNDTIAVRLLAVVVLRIFPGCAGSMRRRPPSDYEGGRRFFIQ